MSLVDLFEHFTAKPESLTWFIDILSQSLYHESPKINLSSSDVHLELILREVKFKIIDRIFIQFKFDANFRSSIYYSISLINKKGQKCNTQVGRAKNGFNGHYMFDYDYLFDQANGLLQDGTLKIYCEVYELDDDEGLQSCVDKNNLASLSRDNQSLLDSGELSDIVLLVGGRELKAHKLILSTRSMVFEKMFEQDLEKTRVEIEDMNASAGEDFLKFIYTGKVSDLEQHVYELFVAADKYQIDSLKSYCGSCLAMSLSTSALPAILKFLDDYSQKVSTASLKKLKSKFVDYITRHKTEFKEEDWNELTTRQPELMFQVWKGGNGL